MVSTTLCGRLAVALIFSVLACPPTARGQSTIHGIVSRAESGAALPGVTLSIGAPSMFGGYYEIANRLTAADGAYDWTGGCNVFNPPYSFCRVKASAPGFADSAAYFDPTTAQSFVLNLSMHVSASISGHVRYAADGSAAAGTYVRLTCTQSDAPICDHYGITAPTDADGSYVFSDLPGGSYRLCSGGLEAGTIAQCHDHVDHGALADDQGYTPLLLVDGETRTSVDFDLAAGGSIRGTLHDGYANTVLHSPSLALEIYDASGNLFGGTSMGTDNSGTYVVQGLPSGSFYLKTSISGPWIDGQQVYPNLACDAAGNCPPPNSGQSLVIGAAATINGIDFTVHPFAIITGQVHAAEDGSLLGGIPVQGEMCGPSSYCSASTDQSVSAAGTGRYAIYAPELHGLYIATNNVSPFIDQVYPSTPCLTGHTCTTTGAALSTTRGVVFSNVDFYLARGSSMSGHVDNHGETGTSVVSIYDQTMHPLTNAFAGANGLYITPAWMPGTYFLAARLGSACIFYSAQPCLYGDQDPATFQPTPIALSDGEIRTDIDFVLYPTDLVFHDGFGAK
jgi:hypothetical protein